MAVLLLLGFSLPLPGAAVWPPLTQGCSGDIDHHPHAWSHFQCHHEQNPEYPTDIDVNPSTPEFEGCPQRARNCNACYNCCNRQANEAIVCRCNLLPVGREVCRRGVGLEKTACRQICFGYYEGTCEIGP